MYKFIIIENINYSKIYNESRVNSVCLLQIANFLFQVGFPNSGSLSVGQITMFGKPFTETIMLFEISHGKVHCEKSLLELELGNASLTLRLSNGKESHFTPILF